MNILNFNSKFQNLKIQHSKFKLTNSIINVGLIFSIFVEDISMDNLHSMDLEQVAQEFNNDHEILELKNEITSAQYKLPKVIEVWKLEDSKCRKAGSQYAENCRKLYLCKLTYEIICLNAHIKNEIQVHEAEAQKRKENKQKYLS